MNKLIITEKVDTDKYLVSLTDETLTLTLGYRARFQLENGDTYQGRVVAVNLNQITIDGNCWVWYHNEFAPHKFKYSDDQICFIINAKTNIDNSGIE